MASVPVRRNAVDVGMYGTRQLEQGKRSAEVSMHALDTKQLRNPGSKEVREK
jgi:hypothetical protein